MNTYQGVISKEEFVKELKAHQKADAFVKGIYGTTKNGEFKGCAVGCSLESIGRTKKLSISQSDHTQYPKLLGIPEWLARVEDTIFEGLPLERSKSWPVEFAQAIPENVDLEQIKGPFLVLVMENALKSFDHSQFPDVKKALDRSITLWKRDDVGSPAFLKKADKAAEAAEAAWAAWAAWAAEAAEAARAARAAWAAAWAARAAWAAEAAEAAWAAAWAARAEEKTYEHFADELLKLLKNTK